MTFPASRKIHIPGKIYPELRVPMREISLSNNTPITVYDTSGPYTDPEVKIDLKEGLPPQRLSWLRKRADVKGSKPLRAKPGKNVSQMHYAKNGVITEEMEYIAIRENLSIEKMHEEAKVHHTGQSFGAAIPDKITAEFVRDEVARGRAIIPANINHLEIGRAHV